MIDKAKGPGASVRRWEAGAARAACKLLTNSALWASVLAASAASGQECRSCHREIDSAYRKTGMGRSIETPAEVPGFPQRSADFSHAPSRSRFTIRREGLDLKFRQEEGGLTAKIAAYIGSGSHSRTPVHRKPNGKFAELPLSWYSDRGGYWAMSPGYDRANHSGMRRELSEGCIFCHSAYPQEGKPLAAIDCQRCHGAGAGHPDSRTAIVNPAKLETGRRLEVCLQCHLETGSRTNPDAIRRVGRGPFSFRPGEELGQFQIYFAAENPPPDDSIPVNGAGSGMLASACYQRSGGKLLCTACHDPHGLRKTDADASCVSCHPGAHTDRGSCVSCHMPKRRTADAVHVVMTDHRIRRYPPAGDPLAARVERHGAFSGAVKLAYPPVLDPDPETRAYLGIAASDAPLLASAIRGMSQPPAEFLFELGRLDPASAGRAFERALAADPRHRGARLALAESLLARNLAQDAIVLIESAPEQDPPLLNTWAAALVALKRPAEAIRILQRALEADSWDPLTHFNLGIAHAANGDRTSARESLRRVLVLQPDFEKARKLLNSPALR